MKKHGLTDHDLDAMAQPYEDGEYRNEDGKILLGCHLKAVGKRKVTVLYDALDIQQVENLARKRRVPKSEILP